MFPKTASQLAAFLAAMAADERTQCTQELSRLELMEKTPGLSDTILAEIKSVRTAIDSRLKGLLDEGKITEALKAGNEMSYAMEYLHSAYVRSSDAYKTVQELLTKISGIAATAPAAMAGAVSAEIQKQVDAGGLFRKEAYDLAVKTARNTGAEEGRAAARKEAGRRGEFQTLGLTTVPDSVLALDDDAFATALAGAKQVVDQVGQYGISATELCSGELASLPFAQEPERKARLSGMQTAFEKGGGTARPPVVRGNPQSPANKGPRIL